MELTYIKARNFLSFEDIEYTFVNGVPTLLVGDNKTDRGQESNGSGKSGIPIIIEYAILHTTSKKVTDANLVRWYQTDDAHIELEITCPIRKETLLIEREISIKNGGRSQLTVNGVVKHAYGDNMVAAIDKYIIEWIGITKEDIQNFFLLSKFKYTSFFAASNAQLIQLIGRFSNSSIIEGIDKDIMDQADELTKSLVTINTAKERLYGSLEAHKLNLEAERKADKKELVERKLAEIDNQIIELGDKIIHHQTQIGLEDDRIRIHNDSLKQKSEELQEANRKLNALNSEDEFAQRYFDVDQKLQLVKESKENTEKGLDSLKISFNETSTILQEIDRNIKGSVQCPKCSHVFLVGDETLDIEGEKLAYEETQGIIDKLNETIEKTKKAIEEFQPKITDIKRERYVIESEEETLRNQKRTLNNSIIEAERQKGVIEVNIQSIRNIITGHQESITSVKRRIDELTLSKKDVNEDTFDNKDRIASILELIANCEKEITECDAKSKVIEDKVFDTKTWAYTFKEFIQYLSVKTLKILEGYANHFLESIKTDLRVVLEGYKLKADGTLSDKITAYVITNGERKEFNSFSGGERVRLECAMILTVSHAINSTHRFGGLNFISIDEIFESSDSMGIQILTTSLMELGNTMLITTHVPGANYDCPVLKVVKENKISRLYA